MLVDKFSLCWHGDIPPACASQVSLRIPSCTTTTNGLLSTVSHISTTDLPSAAYLSFPSWFLQSYCLRWHCDVCWMSSLSKSPSTKKRDERYQLSIKPGWISKNKNFVLSIWHRHSHNPYLIGSLNSSSGYTSLAPYQITAFFTSPYDDNKTCTWLLYRLCRLENLRNWIIGAIQLLRVLLRVVVGMKSDSQRRWWSRRRVIWTKFIRKFQDPHSALRCVEERSWLVTWNVSFSSILIFKVIYLTFYLYFSSKKRQTSSLSMSGHHLIPISNYIIRPPNLQLLLFLLPISCSL